MDSINQEALKQRAEQHANWNGVNLVRVIRLDTLVNEAQVYLYFDNASQLDQLSQALQDWQDCKTGAKPLKTIFPISGGTRILAGPGTGQIQVTGGSRIASQILSLTMSPIGDYSVYTLTVDFVNIDPLRNEIQFRFRPGCFSTNCSPEWQPAAAPSENPVIDYVAKDYESFRHTLISAMMDRVTGWQVTSEADFDLTLIELFSAAGDELSDYQDRVMNEAYLSTARKRVSLARHARLMDYHIHQGQQSDTLLALEVQQGAGAIPVPSAFLGWAGGPQITADSRIFMSARLKPQAAAGTLHPLLNGLSLYTWDNVKTVLPAGSTSADLKMASQSDACEVQNLIRAGQVTQILIQEWMDPETGRPGGADPDKRQCLRLLAGDAGGQAIQNSVQERWFVRICWQAQDQLQQDYSFTSSRPEGLVQDISLFHGNLLQVFHGEPCSLTFKAPDAVLRNPWERFYEPTEKWGTLCRLDPDCHLAYRYTPLGNEIPPFSTLEVRVSPGGTEAWQEMISLVHSQEEDEHFIVETDEYGRSAIRFGTGQNGNAGNGKSLPEGAVVTCTFQAGGGLTGNVGRDKIANFSLADFPWISKVWNPFDVTNGLDPEPAAEILRRVPEAYLQRQLRAITLADYERRAMELPEVSAARAEYNWTGSWRSVRIAIDPTGARDLALDQLQKIARYLDSVCLIGEDLEIRLPNYVPLRIKVTLSIDPQYWPEDIRLVLDQEFSDGYLPDGRMGFFHPDLWTFGQSLAKSQILGRVQAVPGVSHVLDVTMHGWCQNTAGNEDLIEVRINEIIRVRNDHDHLEWGFIDFDLQGGRQ
jgi:hypothetical protein